MIYLIDDNKYGQMAENYRIDFTKVLAKYPDSITWLMDLSASSPEVIIKNCSCILIHDSLDGKENKEKVVALAKINNIPYCIFSNGFTATIFAGISIKEIKKDRLYFNLIVFLNHFVEQKTIDFKLLSLGENYEVEKASILQDRLISGTIFNNRSNFNYEVAFPGGSQAFKDLIELVHLSNHAVDFSSFEDEFNSSDTTAEIMRQEVIKMAKKIKQKYER
ncbi:hypothetical protein ABIB62_000640 [Mucilaginibacter sp. UYP25]|uniref:hypothetical protein n=1 Tax=unclassified Mucilaginibacter TaxID=2617802 RepID=UPI003399928A